MTRRQLRNLLTETVNSPHENVIGRYGSENIIDIIEEMKENGSFKIHPLVRTYLNILTNSLYNSLGLKLSGFPLVHFSGLIDGITNQFHMRISLGIIESNTRNYSFELITPRICLSFKKNRSDIGPMHAFNDLDSSYGCSVFDEKRMEKLQNSSSRFPMGLLKASCELRDIEWIKGYINRREPFFIPEYNNQRTFPSSMHGQFLVPPSHHFCVHEIGTNLDRYKEIKASPDDDFEIVCQTCQYYRRFKDNGFCPIGEVMKEIQTITRESGVPTVENALLLFRDKFSDKFKRMLEISQINLKKHMFTDKVYEEESTNDFRNLMLAINQDGVYF